MTDAERLAKVREELEEIQKRIAALLKKLAPK